MSCAQPDACLLLLPHSVLRDVLSYLTCPDLARLACCSSSTNAIIDDEMMQQALCKGFPDPFFHFLPASRKPPCVSWRALVAFLHQGRKFSAQVFNRELGNPAEDFSNSCYDATVRFQGYDASSGLPLFQALYLPQGKVRVLETGITASRLRAAPPHSHSHKASWLTGCFCSVYGWDVCQVQPGALVEVQWRVEQRHPFGWWAGVVREVRTRSVIVEFQQVEVNEDVRFGYLGGLRLLSPVESQQWRAQHLAVPEPHPALGSGHRPEPETVIRGEGSQ
ncbi:hypothetical protein QJQ45_025649 [Haematococcus lacustris]|nr:hypothetical protein QJQ45_025649 [Haematococcus lacustris]